MTDVAEILENTEMCAKENEPRSCLTVSGYIGTVGNSTSYSNEAGLFYEGLG